MQVTIDSGEPLDRVTDVIGALYGVRLVVVADDGGTADDAGTAHGDGADGSSGRSGRARGSSGPRSTDSRDSTDSADSAAERRRRAAIAASTAARRSAARGRRGSARVDAAVVRAWAQREGMTVSDRGQLPKAVLDAYHAENG